MNLKLTELAALDAREIARKCRNRGETLEIALPSYLSPRSLGFGAAGVRLDHRAHAVQVATGGQDEA